MRTTLNLDDRLARAAKKEAAERGVTLTSVIEDALRGRLVPRPSEGPFELRMPVVEGREPPDLDIADREALYELLERADGS